MSDLNFYNAYVFTSGTSDFQPLSDQIIVPSTAVLNTLVCQNITILGDTVEEDEETFTVTASVTSPDTITQPDTFTVTIEDDRDGRFDKKKIML